MQDETLKPYLIEAFYNWAIDHNLTPFIKTEKSQFNNLPLEFSNEDYVVLNIGEKATSHFIFDSEGLSFNTNFSNNSFKVFINYNAISKIFTKETGYGLEFSVIKISNPTSEDKRSHLTLIK